MEELFKNIGVTIQTWVISLIAAMLFGLYRIFEPVEPLTTRRVITVMIMVFIAGLLVPGLIVNWFNITDPFMAAGITGITVVGFEQVIALSKRVVLRNIDKTVDENGNG